MCYPTVTGYRRPALDLQAGLEPDRPGRTARGAADQGGHHMRRIAATITMAAVAATTAFAPSGSSVAGTTDDTARAVRPGEVRTQFAMHARGLGTKAVSGDLPVGSDPTATKTINCTTMAGRTGENFIAQQNLPDLGTVSEVRTRVWTTKRGGTVATNARQSIASLTLAQSELGSLELTGITSRSRSWHDAEGYHSTASAKVAGISLTLPGQEPQQLDLPTPGQPVEIPGLLTIKLGSAKKAVTGRFGSSSINALDIQLPATSTRVKAAYSRTRIAGGVVSGLFDGYSAGLSGDVLDELVELGKTPLHQMPCEGTGGQLTDKTVAEIDVPSAISVDGLRVEHRASQRKGLAKGFEGAEIAQVSLGDGAVLIEGIRARANVRREGGDLVRNARGTRIGSLTVDGEPQTLPLEETIEVPGVARLEPKVVKRLRGGLHVVALRVELLDGTGATIDLGIARLRIHRR